MPIQPRLGGSSTYVHASAGENITEFPGKGTMSVKSASETTAAYPYDGILGAATKHGDVYVASGTYSVVTMGKINGLTHRGIGPETIRNKREACGVQLAARARFDIHSSDGPNFSSTGPIAIRIAEECSAILDARTMCRIWTNVATAERGAAVELIRYPAQCRPSQATRSAPEPIENELQFCTVKGQVLIDHFIRVATSCPSQITQVDAILINDKVGDEAFQETVGQRGFIDIGGTKGPQDGGPKAGELLYEMRISGVKKVGRNYQISGFYGFADGGIFQGHVTGKIQPETIRNKREACGVQIALRAAFDAYGRTPHTVETPNGTAFRIRAARECHRLMDISTMCRIWKAAATQVKERRDQGIADPRECR